MNGLAADNVDFTPYTSRLEEEAGVQLRALFELSDSTRLTWHLPRDGALHVVLGDPKTPSLEFDVERLTPETRAWFKGKRLALSYRKGRQGQDPMEDPTGRSILAAVRDRVEALDGEAWQGGRLAELLRTLGEVQKYDEVEEYYFRQARPRELIIRLGFRCNQDCWFCWQGRKWPEPPAELYHRWLEEAAAAGHRVVFFSGGEPTIHKELPELLRRARKEFGMAAWIQTNAIQLGKPRFMQKMLASGLNGVFVSYHASDDVISDKMTRAPKTHGLTERGIRACLDSGVLVELNCVVERANYMDLVAHAERIIEEFVVPYPRNPVRRVSYSHPHEYYDQAAYEHAVISLEKVQPYLSAAVTKLHEAGVAVEGIGTCGFPPCLLRENPKILRWLVPNEEHDADVDGRTYGAACNKCVARSRCLGVRREYLERCGEGGLKAFKKSPF